MSSDSDSDPEDDTARNPSRDPGGDTGRDPDRDPDTELNLEDDDAAPAFEREAAPRDQHAPRNERASEDAPAAPPARRRGFIRGVWRWTKRGVVALIVLLVVARFALPYALPGILARWGRGHGLDIQYTDLRLGLLQGELSLSGLVARPLAAASAANSNATASDTGVASEALFGVEFVDFDLDVMALWRGDVRVRRAIIDGVTVRLAREADGSWEYTRFFPAATADTSSADVEPEKAPAPKQPPSYDFTPPLRIDAARLQHVRLHLVDRSAATPLDTQLLVDVRLTDVGAPDRDARLEIDARSKELLDRFRVEGTLRGGPQSLEAALEVALDGFRPQPLAGMLAGVGLEPLATELDAALTLDARVAPKTQDANTGSERASVAIFSLRDLQVIADVEESFAVDSIAVEIPHLAPQRIHVAQAHVQGVRGRARRRADGALIAAGFALLPTDGPATEAASNAKTEASAPTASAPPSKSEEVGASTILEVDEVLVEACTLRFEDAAVAPAADLAFELVALRIKDLVLDPARPDSTVTAQLDAVIPGVAGALALEVSAAPLAAPRTLRVAFDATELDGAAIAAYLAPLGLAPDLQSGSFRLAAEAGFTPDATGGFRAELDVSELALLPGGGGPAITLQEFKVVGFELDAAGEALGVSEVALVLDRLEATRDEAGVVRFAGLRTLRPDEVAALPATPSPSSQSPSSPAPSDEAAPPSSRAASDATGSSNTDGAPNEARSATPADRPPLRLTLGELRAGVRSLRVVDGYTARPVDIALSELELELTSLSLGGGVSGDEPNHGTLAARFAAAGLARSIALDATLSAGDTQKALARGEPGSATSFVGVLGLVRPVTIDLRIAGEGLVTDAVDPWLTELGFESTLQDGTLGLALAASATPTAAGDELTATLSDVRFLDGATSLVSLERVEVDRIVLAPGSTAIGTVSLRGLHAGARRAEDGALELLGLRFPAAPSPAPNVAGDADSTAAAGATAPIAEAPIAEAPIAEAPIAEAPIAKAPVTTTPAPDSAPRATGPGAGGEPADAQDPAPVSPAVAEPAHTTLERLTVADVRFDWDDRALPTPVTTALEAAFELESLHLGVAGPPATFDVRLAVPGSVEELRIEGSLDLADGRQKLASTLTGTGLEAGPLAAYLPPEIAVKLRDGRVAAAWTLDTGPASAGGRELRFELRDFDVRDGAEGAPLAGLARFTLAASRLDSAAGVYQIDALETEGFVVDVERTGPERFEALGFVFDAALAAPSDPLAGAPVDGEPRPPSGPAPNGVTLGAATTSEATPSTAAEVTAPPAPPAPRVLVVGLPGVRSEDLPTVDIGVFQLGFDRLRFVDRTAPEAVPLELRARLGLKGGTRLLGPDPEELPPIELTLAGAAPPFVGDMRVALSLSPFAPTPALELEVDVSGISGPGLAQSLPELATSVDLSKLLDGHVTGQMTVTCDVARRGPAAFDLSSGIGVTVELTELGMRATRGGELLAGIERVFVDAPRLRPTAGDFPLASVEIVRPTFRARRTAEGLELLGVVLRDPPTPGSEDTASETRSPETASTETAPLSESPAANTDLANTDLATATSATAVNPKASVVRIGELTLSGLDVVYEDVSVEPPFRLPLTDADVELRGFSTEPGSTVVLHAELVSGRVSLPERKSGDSLVSGILGAAAGFVTGRASSYRTEERPLWDSLVLSARVTLTPEAPKGVVSLELESFELPALRGLAASSGVQLGDGLVDTRVTVRLLAERGVRLDTRTVFSSLFISEPPGGPISRYLSLPAPLDTVLYVLRDENEQQVIPLSLTLPPEGASMRNLLAKISVTLGRLIGEAIASSPLRIGSGALGLLGLTGGSEAPPLGAPYVVDFPVLDSSLDPSARRVLADLVADVRRVPGRTIRLEHELGGGDLAAGEQTAQLTPEALKDLGAALTGNRDTLHAERDELAAEVRNHFAVGRTTAAEEARIQLVDVEARLTDTEAALDQVYGRLSGASSRDVDRGARALAVLLGEARLTAVRDALEAAGLPPTRIETRRPRANRSTGDAGGRVQVTQR